MQTFNHMEATMAKKIAEHSFEGAVANIYYSDHFPDGMSEKDSNFHNGYLEIFVFGTGELPHLKCGYWSMTYVWPRYEMVICEESSQALVIVDESCSFDDMEIGLATLRAGPEAPRHPIVTVDFKLPDGDIIKKIVLLKQDGSTVEIPDDTLH